MTEMVVATGGVALAYAGSDSATVWGGRHVIGA